MKLFQLILNGIYKENPVARLVLGMCATLAVTTSVINGLGMGLATMFVLLSSNILVSSLRKITPREIRIPVFIVVIASFTTMADLIMAATTPELHKALGIFIPLIVVNCIIFGRAEAFASKNSVIRSAADGLGMGIGFTMALVIMGAIREMLGAGELLGMRLFGPNYDPALAFVLPPGAFMVLALLIGAMNWTQAFREEA